MQALHITSHGPPVALRVTDVPLPPRGPDEVRIQIEAAGINPSDVLSLEGRFPSAVLPRILGRDFSGRVPFTTAWTCLVTAARVQAGETVVVSGAAGAVGWAAGEISSALGARVVALVKDAAEAARLDRTRISGVARSDLGNLSSVVREVTAGAGAQVALNGVGSPIFAALLESLGPGGRLCVYSAAAGREVTLNLFDFYRRRLSVLGINTAILTVVDTARILDQLRPLFESGRVRPHPSIASHPLTDAARAYAAVAGGSPSKVVLVPRPAGGS